MPMARYRTLSVRAGVTAVLRRWRWRWGLLALVLIGLGVTARGYWNATRDPVIRTATLAVADWPEGQAPIKVLLLSDIHVAGPDMPPERLERLVAGFNALRADLILIGGDLVSEKRVATHIYTPCRNRRSARRIACAAWHRCGAGQS